MRVHLPLKRKQLNIFKFAALSFFTLVITLNSNAQWAFLDGNVTANWGTKGVASDNNQPSARNSYASCSDKNGNIWIFGGSGSDAYGNNGNLNDLWKYNASTNQWTWVSGNNDGTVDVISTYGTKGVADPDNVPSVRSTSGAWADPSGNIWIWGGNGYDVNGNSGSLNDLWKYNIATKEWTWMNGSNLINQPSVIGTRGTPSNDNMPSAIRDPTSSSDKFGNFWLCGYSPTDYTFDLWKYSSSTNQWTFLGKNNFYGVYGTKGVPSSDNVPGYRDNHSSATDSSGNFWIFGGYGYINSSYGDLNDLWKYNQATDMWTWVSGSNSINQIGVYGTQGIESINNHPGARYHQSISFDIKNTLFLFGGYGYSGVGTQGTLNDLWNYNITSSNWTWISGSKSTGQGTVYGIKGIPSNNNHPGAGYSGGSTFNYSNKLYLYAPGGTNEVWSYTTNNNIAPKVSITSPDNNATYAAPATINISASASDADGTISYIRFYNGSTLLKTDSTSPYTYTWSDVATGDYTITAKATDNGGLTTTSAAINISVTNKAPVVSITSPDNNAIYISPATIKITATASDADGTISKVEFYNNSTLLQTDTASPYTVSLSDAQTGSYSITAKAYDNNGLATTSDAVNITVVDNKAPVVMITSPANNSTYTAPATINITATASDSDGTISYVQFYNSTTLLKTDSTSPYNYTLVNAEVGDDTIIAKATDDLGLIRTYSITITIVNANKAPTVKITSPADNIVFPAPATFTINATANDSDGSISYVQFYNGSTLLGTDSTSPYTYTFSNIKAGNYTLTAKAFDNKDQATTSDVIQILVGTNKFPTVKITSPTNNTVYSAPATITLNATATDKDGTISVVKFYNGGTLLSTDSTSPYTYTLNNPAAGNYSLVAKATDNNGGRSSSASVAVVVSAQINKAPVVSITSPAGNTVYNAPANITISATASDSDGTVSRVRFYNGGTLLTTDSTSPYTCTLSNLLAGNYSIVAKATDNNGLTSSSSSVTVAVSVTPNKAPVVSITSPARNAVYAAASTIAINASAADPDANDSITDVKFYSGATLLQTDSIAPYTYALTNAAAGTYSVTAKATDNHGLFSSSASVTFTVSAALNKAPTVSITSPANNATYKAPATITINATASDADGSVSNVQFYSGSTLLKTDSTSPYNYTFNNLAAGTYSITAKATDNLGLFSSSASAAIIVSAVTNKPPIVSIISPDSNSVYTAPATITINALASDEDGTISSVKFYNGTTYLKTISASPYTYTLPNLAAGNYSFTAKATDNNGTETISAAVTISVRTPNKPPTVRITNPVNNATYTAPATITINALAADVDGTISSVKFYSGTTYLKAVSASPYTYTLSNLEAGTYTFTAKATDDLGAQTISAAVKVKVVNASIVAGKHYSENEKTALNDPLSVKLSPNPASSIVNIQTVGLQQNKPAILSIISVSGIVLKTMRISNAVTQLDVSSLVSGVYMIKVVTGDKVMYKQFVKL